MRHQPSSDKHGRPGIALAGIIGLGLGILSGLFLSEMLGTVDSTRMRGAVRRMRNGIDDDSTDPAQLERDLLSALRGNPTTRQSDIDVHAIGHGLIELTGTVPDERTRTIAQDLASSVAGADVVVNRILVEGFDTLEQPVRVSEST